MKRLVVVGIVLGLDVEHVCCLAQASPAKRVHKHHGIVAKARHHKLLVRKHHRMHRARRHVVKKVAQ